MLKNGSEKERQKKGEVAAYDIVKSTHSPQKGSRAKLSQEKKIHEKAFRELGLLYRMSWRHSPEPL